MFLRFVSAMSGLCLCLSQMPFLRAYSPGDIIIGGLFPLHVTTNRSTTPGPLFCSDYDVSVFLLTQVMIHTIDQINLNTSSLSNLTLGYDIYDTCGDVSVAMLATLQLLKSQSNPKIKAVIGARNSEVSVATARVTALSSLAQISYSSTSEVLSNKMKFPTFLRTISSDKYQTQGITELVKQFNWKTVAIIGSDDDYGKSGSGSLETLFSQSDICIEFINILPDNFNSSYLADLVHTVNESFAEAIIMFTKEINVHMIMKAAVTNRLNRTWIASDSWAKSTYVSTIKDIVLAGQVFGFISKKNEVPGFVNYVNSSFSKTNNTFLEHFLTCCSKSKETGQSCSLTNEFGNCNNISSLVNYIDYASSYNTYLAVHVVYEGLLNLLKCGVQPCEQRNFTAAELLMEIKKVNFTVNNTPIWFDANGDPSLGYDIVHWNVTESIVDFRRIGEYQPNYPKDIKILKNDLVSKLQSVTVTIYNCSKTCRPGQQLKEQNKKCCKKCVPCEDGEYSNKSAQTCTACGPRLYSSPERDLCLIKTEDMLQWFDPLSIVLTTFGGLGIIVTVVFAVLFRIYLHTPIVKAVGGKLCFLELFSLLTCFCLSFTLIGKPTKISCMVGLPVFGIAFSLCISCILSNLFQILVGFSFKLNMGSWLKKLNQPAAVVTVISGIQLALFVSWLYLYPPFPVETILSDIILHECDNGSTAFFIATTGYNAFLGLTCLIFAFKGKKLPDLYKNAYLITISMLLFLIIWLLFIQIYINNYGKKKTATEGGAILISSYSILLCHLAPKCYIMLFKKELNNETAITEYIRKHFERRETPVVNS
ncbi:G-protein coupled receptor family C group 6 member A-like [Betta splendens]|uniref:G-protein coupled receptor family C group 6 member A-like n=1 Tax=Betta splendens TaxID=158456 RepID=A0A6P7LL56_BETSP|nr:G-protein coupled receptor family C group 6 member A-like [Betta splendens]